MIDELLELAKLAGSDKDYQAWCRTQPSAFSGKADWNDAHGEFRCVYAHCRRAGEAGMGYKPQYSGVPLTWTEHQMQHAHGESYLADFDMEATAHLYLAKWIRSVELKEKGYSSRSSES